MSFLVHNRASFLLLAFISFTYSLVVYLGGEGHQMKWTLLLLAMIIFFAYARLSLDSVLLLTAGVIYLLIVAVVFEIYYFQFIFLFIGVMAAQNWVGKYAASEIIKNGVILYAFIVLVGVVVFILLDVQYESGLLDVQTNRGFIQFSPFFEEPSDLQYFLVCLIVFMSLNDIKIERLHLLCISFILVFSGGIKAILCLVLLFLLYFNLIGTRGRYIYMTIMAAVVALAVFEMYPRIVDVFNFKDSSFIVKADLLRLGWNVFLDNPYVGVGSTDIAPYYKQSLLYGVTSIDLTDNVTSNAYVLLLAGFGIGALFFIIYFAVLMLRASSTVDYFIVIGLSIFIVDYSAVFQLASFLPLLRVVSNGRYF